MVLVPHGGYILSLATNAASVYMSTHHPSLNQPDCITSHIEFLARSSVGEVTISITPLKLGRQFTNLRVQLLQSDSKDPSKQRLCVETLFVQGNLALEAENGQLNLETKPLLDKKRIPKRSECTDMEGTTKEGQKWSPVRPAAFKIYQCLVNGSDEFGTVAIKDGGEGPSVKEQWVRWVPTSGDKFKVHDLPYLADAFRPIPESYGLKGKWYPTVSFAMDIKRGGEWEWLFLRIEMTEMRNGRFGLDVIIADENGDVVATSRHVALILGFERNSNGRKDGSKI